jgi:hypothetical protein
MDWIGILTGIGLIVVGIFTLSVGIGFVLIPVGLATVFASVGYKGPGAKAVGKLKF